MASRNLMTFSLSAGSLTIGCYFSAFRIPMNFSTYLDEDLSQWLTITVTVGMNFSIGKLLT